MTGHGYSALIGLPTFVHIYHECLYCSRGSKWSCTVEIVRKEGHLVIVCISACSMDQAAGSGVYQSHL